MGAELVEFMLALIVGFIVILLGAWLVRYSLTPKRDDDEGDSFLPW